MSPEGELVMAIAWDGARVTGVEIRSTRPHVANRLLAGRSPAEAVAAVPRLYSICGRSQAVAAALACEAAAGRDSGTDTLAARARLVRAEMIQEYLWRTLLDWPALVGQSPAPRALGDARRALAAAIAADEGASRYAASVESRSSADTLPPPVRESVVEFVLGNGEPWTTLDDAPSGERWIERAATVPAALVAKLMAERPTLGASDVPTLPADGAAVAHAVGDELAGGTGDAFERAPAWTGRPAETGALARMREQPLVAGLVGRTGRSAVARFVARVVELIGLVRPDAPRTAMPCGALSTPGGIGIGWVETARGLLVHAVELAAERITRYRIVAPTEWNFHPQGALAAGLVGVPASSAAEAQRLAQIVVQSLDPCVAARVEIVHA